MKKKYITPDVYSKRISPISILAASNPTTLEIEDTKTSVASHDYEILSKRGEQLLDDEEE